MVNVYIGQELDESVVVGLSKFVYNGSSIQVFVLLANGKTKHYKDGVPENHSVAIVLENSADNVKMAVDSASFNWHVTAKLFTDGVIDGSIVSGLSQFQSLRSLALMIDLQNYNKNPLNKVKKVIPFQPNIFINVNPVYDEVFTSESTYNQYVVDYNGDNDSVIGRVSRFFKNDPFMKDKGEKFVDFVDGHKYALTGAAVIGASLVAFATSGDSKKK